MQHGSGPAPADNLDVEEGFGRRPAASSYNAPSLVALQDVGSGE
jgi:hypothetical protein